MTPNRTIRMRALQAIKAVQTVSPIGAGLIFAAGFIAAHAGLLVGLTAVAFLVGLHVAQQSPADKPAPIAAAPAAPAAPIVNGSKPAVDGKLAAALEAGLVVRGITLGAPPAAKVKQSK